MKTIILISALVLSAGAAVADTAADFITKGMQNLTNRQAELAISNFSEAIKLDPKNATTYRWRAIAYGGAKKYQEEIADLGKVIELEPGNPDNYYGRGQNWSLFGRFNEAIADYSDTIRLSPKFYPAFIARGEAYYRSGDFVRALKDETAAIELGCSNSSPYQIRGLVYKQTEEYAKAIKEFDKVVELAPADPGSYVQRAGIQNHLKRYDAAIADCNKALALLQKNPRFAKGDPFIFQIRAIAYAGKGDSTKAIQDFDQVVAADPKNGSALASRGNLRAEKGDYGQAIADCQKAVEVSSNNIEAYNNLAWILATCPDAKFRDGRKALENAKKACELSQWKNAYCIGTLAAANAEAGNFAEAVKWQKQSIEIGSQKGGLPEAQEMLKLYEAKKPYREKKAVVRVDGSPADN